MTNPQTTPGISDDFKIISNGRDLPFPMMRLLFALGCFFLAGWMCHG